MKRGLLTIRKKILHAHPVLGNSTTTLTSFDLINPLSVIVAHSSASTDTERIPPIDTSVGANPVGYPSSNTPIMIAKHTIYP